ncbi:L domain-like protein [Thozetella sp. PMI_491]|nr:L domain-like protein [Thozetella sp. PMI_491]
MPPPGFTQPVRSRTPSPEKANNDGSVSRYGSKTLAARPVKSRPSLNGLFKKPSLPALDKPAPSGMARKASTASQRSSAASCETDPSTVTSASTVTTNDSAETTPGTAYRKSSAALREQIARAKAAKKAAVQPTSAPSVDEPVAPFKTPLVPTDNTFDFGLHADPFSQRGDEKSMAKVLQGRLATARTSGRLNIAAMNLREIPAEVMDMYSLESVGRNDGSWAESVDLTRFVAADNELEMIADSVFPDVDVHDFSNEEESQGNIFGGLETLDLHGNMLIALPMGLRRLELLTSLNLSQNRLANNCLEVISQIKALKDLKLGGNLLYGPLDPCFSSLQNLEILDLHGNNIASLPSNFGNLARLRILNISENVFETIPFEILAELPLTELVARKNQLSGTLIADSVKSMPALQTLDVSANQLVQLIAPDKTCDMPALHQLTLSVNRLQTLPDITGWKNLFTLSADENSINAFPEGFTKLEKLRSVDFSSNDIRVIPAEVGLMDNLSMLRLSGNPLRDKKFCSASTDELKSTLAQRLEPSMVYHEAQDFGGAAPGQMGGQNIAKAVGAEDDDDDDDQDDFATPPTSAPGSPARQRSQTLTGQTWPVKSGGVLDRSKTESSSLHPVICSKVAAAHKIRDVQLHHNLFTTMPDSLSFFADTLTSLSMAKNQLLGEEYLTADLELPELKELNLADNKITSLAPLAAHLRAPNLVKIDVSLNRIATLPAGHLRDIFPKLEILLVSNNHLAELDPECLKGLRIVNASNNDIAHLNPRLGLLDLESLLVTGNRFRVPKWNVLDRGTEATLRWLRSRVPLAELAEWREQGGHADDVD